MIMLVNDYSTKYWLNNDIQDCGNDNNLIIDDDIEIIIDDDDEKLKDKYNNELYFNKLNAKSNNRSQKFTSKNRNCKDTPTSNRSKFNRYENKNDRINYSKKTNSYINIQQTHHTNSNKKDMPKVSSLCRISEYKRRTILLDTFPKPRIKDLL